MRRCSDACYSSFVLSCFSSLGFVFLPFIPEIPMNKADASEDPVNFHCNPNTEYTETKIDAKQITESNPENPHGKNR